MPFCCSWGKVTCTGKEKWWWWALRWKKTPTHRLLFTLAPIFYAKNAASPVNTIFKRHLWNWVICCACSEEELPLYRRYKGLNMALTTILYCSCLHCSVLCINPMQIAPLCFFWKHTQTLPISYIHTHINTHSSTSPSVLLHDIISYKHCLTSKRQSASSFFLFFVLTHKSEDHICCCLLWNCPPKHVSFFLTRHGLIN